MAYRILIVDDENALQDMVREILSQAGYETDAALSCAQAVERFRIGNPDAVLLDVNLPDGDGFSLFGGSTAKRRTRRGSGTRRSTGARASCAATARRPP